MAIFDTKRRFSVLSKLKNPYTIRISVDKPVETVEKQNACSVVDNPISCRFDPFSAVLRGVLGRSRRLEIGNLSKSL